ncbi:nucleoside-triphosphatase [uncultured Pseudoflavonifractor sp.]|uniref:nucleoside-triphosphatase n=1 Tax=uncultured Pseudoflavonifractor sp. TaxID=1221379 RepID=UPI003448E770
MFHTLLVGPSGRGRAIWIKRLLAELDPTPLWGYHTPKEQPDASGRSQIRLCPVGCSAEQNSPVLLGWCKDRQATAIPYAFEDCAGIIEQAGLHGLLLLDELGAMESHSPRFCRAVLDALDRNLPILAWVRDLDTPFLSAVRTHPKARCFYPPPVYDPALFETLSAFLTAQLNAGR